MTKNKKKNIFKKILLTITVCFIAVFSVFGLTYNSNYTRTVSADETSETSEPAYGQIMYVSSTYTIDPCNNKYSDYSLAYSLPMGIFSFSFDIRYVNSMGLDVYMYGTHLWNNTAPKPLSNVVYYSDAGNVSNVVSISRGLFDYDWYSLTAPFRIRDNSWTTANCVIMGVSATKSSTTSFAPYYTVLEKVPISSFQPKDTSNNQLRNEPFTATVLNAFNTINSEDNYRILKFTTVFAEGDSISFYFLCYKDIVIDSTPHYFYAPNGSDEYANGYDAGYNAGYDLGQTNGYDTGYSEGYDLGETNGYQNGYNAGVNTNNSGAFQEGYDRGYNTGKNDGYVIGKEESAEGKYTFTHLITAVIDVPINSFKSLFEFEILGVDLSGFFLGLLTCCVIVAVIRFIL